MPGLKDIEQSIKLEDGGSFVGLYDPTKDVGVQESEFGTRYKFRFLGKDGRMVNVTGGSRLFDKIVGLCGTNDRPRTLKITAKGKAATMDRDYVVEEVPSTPTR
ncbi:MAG TPA: hypothetical protein VJ044_17585 [Candidatus Hodarchaeales archaeon]|nr:hypothetical protein [Candidatus Hodarchaeales archaeon]